MAFLFWLFWSIDLLILLVSIIGKGFKDSFHASDDVPWFEILLGICTIGGFILRVFFKKTVLALAVVSLPLLVLLVMYLIEKLNDK